MGAGVRKTFVSSVEKVVSRSIDATIDSPVSSTCANLTDGDVVKVVVSALGCHGLNAKINVDAVKETALKWNEIFAQWGLPLKIIARQENDSTPADVFMKVSACISSDSQIPEMNQKFLQNLGLSCPPVTDIDPSMARALSTENPAFAYNNFPYGEWLPGRCPGSQGLPSPTDVAALGQICGANKDYVPAISNELLGQLSIKYGNNVIGHFLGGFLADLVRRVVEIVLVKCGDFKHQQSVIKLLSEIVAVTVQVSVMAYFGSYTSLGGTVTTVLGFGYGTLGELLMPDCVRSLVTAVGGVNLGFALFDGFLGTGNWPSELIAALVGHWVAQLGLRGMEGIVEYFYEEEDPAKRAMLGKPNFSLWDAVESTAFTDPVAPWNLGQYMPDCVQTVRRISHVVSDFISSYLNAMVLRQNLYTQDQQSDEDYWSKAFQELDELARVMKRVELVPPLKEVTLKELLRRVSHHREHLSFNFHVSDADPESFWRLLIEKLGTQVHANRIATLDFRGLRLSSDSGAPTPLFSRSIGEWPNTFGKVTVLALDAMPSMFEDAGFMRSVFVSLPELKSLRLTAPAETNDPAAGVPPHDLSRILEHGKLTTLLADVCTVPAVAKDGRPIQQDVKALYQLIAASSTLQTVDLRLTTDMEFPTLWIERLSKLLENNYVLCYWQPLQENGLIKHVMERNRRLWERLMSVSSDLVQVNAILAEIPAAEAQRQVSSLLSYLVNRPNMPQSSILGNIGNNEIEDSVDSNDDSRDYYSIEESNDAQDSDDDVVIVMPPTLAHANT